MKAILFALFVALLMGGCGEPNLNDTETLNKILQNAANRKFIQKRETGGVELLYLPNMQEPFTGWAATMHNNGQVSELQQIKAGVVEGRFMEWDSDGEKDEEGYYKDGEKHGLWTEWHSNGKKDKEGHYKEGEKHGLWIEWDDDGPKERERNYKDGKRDGLSIYYNEDGTESSRSTYKDGELVED